MLLSHREYGFTRHALYDLWFIWLLVVSEGLILIPHRKGVPDLKAYSLGDEFVTDLTSLEEGVVDLFGDGELFLVHKLQNRSRLSSAVNSLWLSRLLCSHLRVDVVVASTLSVVLDEFLDDVLHAQNGDTILSGQKFRDTLLTTEGVSHQGTPEWQMIRHLSSSLGWRAFCSLLYQYPHDVAQVVIINWCCRNELLI